MSVNYLAKKSDGRAGCGARLTELGNGFRIAEVWLG